MLAYKITGDTSYECREITAEEAGNYPAPQHYVSEKPIKWNEKRIVNGVLEDIPVIVAPDPDSVVQTAEQIKHQNLNQLKYIYTAKLNQLLRGKELAEINGKSTTSVIAAYKATNEEWKAKIIEVTKGA